jgi:hypothetical protein
MMPVVRLNDGTFGDLKTISEWLGTKTPTETIDQIVREKMEQLGMERDDEPAVAATGASGAMEFENAPGLSFTKPTSASVNGKAIQSPKWSSILLTMIEQVKAKGVDGNKLVAELNVPAKPGRYEEEGFKHLPNLGISVQGQSAADAWKEVDRLAKKWRIPVTVEFWWRQNPKAQYPGRTGVLRSGD